MNSLALCSLFFTLCFFLIAQSPSLTNARDLHNGYVLIAQICNENQPNKIACTNLLRKDPKVLSATNFVELAKAILELGCKNGKYVQNCLSGLANSTTKDVPAIQRCVIYYGSTVDSFRKSLRMLKGGPRNANHWAKIAGDGPLSCDKDLRSAGIAGDRPLSCPEDLRSADIKNHTIYDLDGQTQLLSYIASLAIERLISA